MTSNTTPFPMDFSNLKRGDLIPPAEVERATMCRSDAPEFWHEQMQLRDDIRRYFRATYGDLVTIRMEGAGLRLLTHPEQAEYAPHRANRAVRQMLTAQAEAAAVDVKQLSDDQRKSHDRFLLRNAFRVQQMLKPPPPELMP